MVRLRSVFLTVRPLSLDFVHPLRCDNQMVSEYRRVWFHSPRGTIPRHFGFPVQSRHGVSAASYQNPVVRHTTVDFHGRYGQDGILIQDDTVFAAAVTPDVVRRFQFAPNVGFNSRRYPVKQGLKISVLLSWVTL